MNSVHWTIIFAVAIFIGLLLMERGKQKTISTAYFRFVLLAVAGLLMLTPFVWLICSAFKDSSVLMEYTFLPPMSKWSAETINISNFQTLFKGDASIEGKVYFWQYILNSLFLSSTTTMVQLFFCSLGGYALAKYDFKGKKFVMAYMAATLMFPGMLFLAPVYKLVYHLGWMDTYWALVIPGAASVFGMFLFRQAMIGVPNSLIEAARIDGASEFGIYLKVVMPLVRPMIGAFCLVSFLGSWNAFIGPQIFLHSKAKVTLPVILNQYVGVYTQQYGVFLAGTLLAIIPPAILFFALEKEFVSGLTSGAVKG